MIGRYPDFDVLDVVDTWDEATKKVVLARLDPPGPLRFFSPERGADAARVLRRRAGPGRRAAGAGGRDGRRQARRRHLDGYRYADMPRDPETWRTVLAGLDHTARAAYGRRFADVLRPSVGRTSSASSPRDGWSAARGRR